jgi:hypothetical protein
MLKVWQWLKRWWKVIAGALGTLIVSFLVWGAYKRKVNSLRDAIDVEKVKTDIARLRGRREELMNQDQVDEAEVAAIDAKLESNKQAIIEVRRRANVPNDELEAEFEKLGY